VFLVGLVLRIISPFNQKIKSGVQGRKQTFTELKKKYAPGVKTFWFHCASLGEFEQGKPVFEALRQQYPDYRVVLSFFSPSGYEVRQNTPLADIVVYLPLDSKTKARQFLDLVQPTLTIFIKYEIWPNFLNALKTRNCTTILISAVFRPHQPFFKWYGGFMRRALNVFDHIFTQNVESKTLLEHIGYQNVTVSGDTRFDRVSQQLTQDNTLQFIKEFKANAICIVFGSTWPEDDKLFFNFINASKGKGLKFIIAPHNIKPGYIAAIKSQLKVTSICYTELNPLSDLEHAQVFILDTIGLLSKVYSYADIAYVGGAAGTTGLHNILEPAVFGTPVIIGKNYNKFPEAKTLIQKGGVSTVANSSEFERTLWQLVSDSDKRHEQGEINACYIAQNKGAVIQILDYIRI
jgi:3-deoxy-D-manno-octulosonic-acid transferase